MDINTVYQQEQSIKATDRKTGYSEQRVRKTLISAGVIPGRADVAALHEAGLTPDEIMHKLNLSRSAVYVNLPYMRTPYKLPDTTVNAQRIKKCRLRKRGK